MGQLTVPKPDDYDPGDLHSPTSRRNARQHPIHFDAVRKPDHHLIDKLIDVDRAGNRRHFHVGRHLWDEVRRVELPQLRLTRPAGQDRDMIDIRILDHRFERVVGAAGREFMADRFLPKPLQS
jgi:hypothetical protein